MKRRGQLSLDFMVGMTMVLLFVGAVVVHLNSIYKSEQEDATLDELQMLANTISKNINTIYGYGADFQIIMPLNLKYLSSVNVTISTGQVSVVSIVNGKKYTASAPIQAYVKPITLSLSQGDKLQLTTVWEGGDIYVEVEKLS